jgi:NitT/TauT family transport system substrate-binding protein
MGAGLLAKPHIARAEAGELRIAEQFGLPFLPFTVMKRQRLLEQEASRLGLRDLTVTWAQVSGGPTMNDALLSGSLDIASAGTPPALTLWDRTRGTLKVRCLAAISGMPFKLVTRNPAVQHIRDFTERDRIALPAVKVSLQSVILQMAALREWGPGGYDRLDHLTVSLAHPDALVALTSGRSEVTAHFGNPPYQDLELRVPGLRSVLDSFEVAGPHSAVLAYASTRFHDANPRLVEAFLGAMDHAGAFIRAEPRAAAELYAAAEPSQAPVELVEALLRDPLTRFRLQPEGLDAFIDFQHRIGVLRQRPESWRDVMFPHALARVAD